MKKLLPGGMTFLQGEIVLCPVRKKMLIANLLDITYRVEHFFLIVKKCKRTLKLALHTLRVAKITQSFSFINVK